MNTPRENHLLDETSRAIGRLEAQGEATAKDVAELKDKIGDVDTKLDKLLARSQSTRITLKHWGMLLAGGSLGGGGIAHLIKKILE